MIDPVLQVRLPPGAQSPGVHKAELSSISYSFDYNRIELRLLADGHAAFERDMVAVRVPPRRGLAILDLSLLPETYGERICRLTGRRTATGVKRPRNFPVSGWDMHRYGWQEMAEREQSEWRKRLLGRFLP